MVGVDVAPDMIATGFPRCRSADVIPNETEFLEVGILPFRQVYELVNASEIRDAMTMTAVLHAARL